MRSNFEAFKQNEETLTKAVIEAAEVDSERIEHLLYTLENDFQYIPQRIEEEQDAESLVGTLDHMLEIFLDIAKLHSEISEGQARKVEKEYAYFSYLAGHIGESDIDSEDVGFSQVENISIAETCKPLLRELVKKHRLKEIHQEILSRGMNRIISISLFPKKTRAMMYAKGWDPRVNPNGEFIWDDFEIYADQNSIENPQGFYAAFVAGPTLTWEPDAYMPSDDSNDDTAKVLSGLRILAHFGGIDDDSLENPLSIDLDSSGMSDAMWEKSKNILLPQLIKLAKIRTAEEDWPNEEDGTPVAITPNGNHWGRMFTAKLSVEDSSEF